MQTCIRWNRNGSALLSRRQTPRNLIPSQMSLPLTNQRFCKHLRSQRIVEQLSTSGLPQILFWTKLGRPGGSSNQDSQAKTRVCRGSPQSMIKQTQLVSHPEVHLHGTDTSKIILNRMFKAPLMTNLKGYTLERPSNKWTCNMKLWKSPCVTKRINKPPPHIGGGISQVSPQAPNKIPRAP